MLLIKGGRILDPLQEIDMLADVLLEDGKISALGKELSAAEADVIDAAGKIVVPGLIDMHVHLREPGYEAKETIASGTRAAVKGGFTAVACMPNTKPVADNAAIISAINERSRYTASCRVYPIGAITKGQKSEELAEIGDMAASGAVAFSDDGKSVAAAELMRLALLYAQAVNKPILAHCEEPSLAEGGQMHFGYHSTLLGLKGIPAVAEEIIIARDIMLAEATGGKLHICHVSTAGSVGIIRDAKKRGINVTAEVAPHHLTLTAAMLETYDTAFKVNPPLRTQEDIAALKAGLCDGTLDCIATDHAPHADEEKAVEFAQAPFGMVGLETALPLMWETLVEGGILSPLELIRKMSTNPAAILGVSGGSLAVGQPADITIIDPKAEEIFDRNKLQSIGKNTPYHGRKLTCLADTVIVGGEVKYNKGAF